MNRIDQLLKELALEPHPEGGYFKETFRSDLMVTSPAVAAERNAVTDIYYLLTRGDISKFHQVMHDEIWHFYEGDALELFVFDPVRDELKRYALGGEDAMVYKRVVPSGCWQAARSLGEYSLMGCTVAPGFDFMDFAFLKDVEFQNELLKKDASLKIFF